MHGLKTIHRINAERAAAYDLIAKETTSSAQRRIEALEKAARAVFNSKLIDEQQKAIFELKRVVDGPAPLADLLGE